MREEKAEEGEEDVRGSVCQRMQRSGLFANSAAMSATQKVREGMIVLIFVYLPALILKLLFMV
jgi:hypothetical protein